jgi:hypothetical protein
VLLLVVRAAGRQETADFGRCPHAKEAGGQPRSRRRRRRRRRREEVQEQRRQQLVFLATFLLVFAPFFCRG